MCLCTLADYPIALQEEDLAKCVNFHAFQAHILDRVVLNGELATAYEIREGLERSSVIFGEKYDLHTRVAYAMAAAQYFLILGPKILDQLLNDPKEELEDWRPGPRFKFQEISGLFKRKDPHSLTRWHFWRDSFRAIAAGKWDENEKSRVSNEAKNLATKTAERMDVIESRVPKLAVRRTEKIDDAGLR